MVPGTYGRQSWNLNSVCSCIYFLMNVCLTVTNAISLFPALVHLTVFIIYCEDKIVAAEAFIESARTQLDLFSRFYPPQQLLFYRINPGSQMESGVESYDLHYLQRSKVTFYCFLLLSFCLISPCYYCP